MWNDLSMTEKAQLIKLGVQSGITDLNTIRSYYNSFNDLSYLEWKKKIKEHKKIDIDNDPSYDYAGYYINNPISAWDMLNKDSEEHFVDKYKTSSHPSFSNQSMYSGYKNKHNPKGVIGGTWINDYNYRLSQSQMDNNWDTDNTLDYFKWAEEHPVNLYAPDGSIILRSVTVTPKNTIPVRKR